MGTASVRLHDGTVVTAEFQDNGDGRVTGDEKVRAQNALADALSGRDSAQVDLYTEALINESGAPPETYRGSFSLGGLVNSGAVRLFGAPPTSNPTAVDSPGDWVAEGNVTETIDHQTGRQMTYTIYREMDRIDDTGRTIIGRRIRVPHDDAERTRVGGAEMDVSDGHGPGWVPVHMRVGEQTIDTDGGARIPVESLQPLQATEIPVRGPIATAPVVWTPAGAPAQQDGFTYFQGPGDRVARRSVTNAGNAQVMVRPGPGGNLAGAVWRAADDADAVPALPPQQPEALERVITRHPGRGEVEMWPLTGNDQFSTEIIPGTRYEVLATRTDPPVRYARPAPENGLRVDRFLWEDRPGHWTPVVPPRRTARPQVATGGNIGTNDL